MKEADSVQGPERFFLVFLRFSNYFLGKSCFLYSRGHASKSAAEHSRATPRTALGHPEHPQDWSQSSPKVARAPPCQIAQSILPQGSPRDPQSSANAALEHPESILRTDRRAAPAGDPQDNLWLQGCLAVLWLWGSWVLPKEQGMI